MSDLSISASKYLSDLLRIGTVGASSDCELLDRFSSRRNEHDEMAELAFAALLARHGPMVQRVCRAALGDRHEVEDAFQATFLVLAVRARSIRRRSSVAAWLHGVALRVAASERSRASRRRRHELARAGMASCTTQDEGNDPVVEHELTVGVQEEIGRLPKKYRAAVVLCYLERLTHEMEGIVKSMKHTKLILVMTAVLFAGLLTTGAGVMGYTANRRENAASASDRSQARRQEIVASAKAQDPPRPPAAKPAAGQGPILLRVDVVDTDGLRLAGADVAVTAWYARSSGSTESVVQRTKTNEAGQIQVDLARDHRGAIARSASIWAHQSGRAIAATSVSFAREVPPSVISLTLDQPAKCTVTVLGPDDRPIGGLRVAPAMLRRTDRPNPVPNIPDEWLERLTATTDAQGVATLSYLPKTMMPLSIRVAGREVAPHSLPVDAHGERNAILKLGRAGRVVGLVRAASGMPLADVPLELWVQGANIRRSVFGESLPSRRITADEIVRLDQGLLKTGSQGAFQTPSTLLVGSSYRVAIRLDGYMPFVSDWVTLSGERAAIPAINLQPLTKLAGQIKDRQGHAVAGARVFLPAGGPSATTDSQGRFALSGNKPGNAVILVEQAGFQFQGWVIDPSAPAETRSLTLIRTSEDPRSVVKPLDDPIPQEESRALADRLLEPYLHEPMGNGNDEPRLTAILALCELDLDRAVGLLKNGEFREDGRLYGLIREYVAGKLARTDSARAEAMVEAISDRGAKLSAMVRVGEALPASERGRKRALLERAATLLEEGPQGANDANRLRVVAAVAEQWLDMGERDRARRVLQDGATSSDVFHTGYLGQLARLEPEQAMALLQKQPRFSNPGQRDVEVTAIAVQLANDDPAEAERFFKLRVAGADRFPAGTGALRLCHRLARVDPPRARRVAATLGDPGIRACAWAYVALGLSEKDKAGAAEAMDRAIEEIDRLRESGTEPGPLNVASGILLLYASNPAAVILPIVERVAPERLGEVFWRAVALHVRIDTHSDAQVHRSNIGYECMLLARYDRQVAAILFEPADASLRSLAARTGSREDFDHSLISAEGCIDPRSAVSLLESLTPPRSFQRPHPAYEARRRLAEMLGMPREQRWMRLWSSMLIRLDD